MKIWFTLTGTNHYYGNEFLEKGMKVRLEKEPDNRHDHEAIKVMMDGIGKIGYVANSPWTVFGESYSAGRLYDKIGDTAKGKVQMVTAKGVLCSLKLKKNADDVVPPGEPEEDDIDLPVDPEDDNELHIDPAEPVELVEPVDPDESDECPEDFPEI